MASIEQRFAEFADIIKTQEPLAPFTAFKVGGPAELFVKPRSFSELQAVIARCQSESVPFRVLGSGTNVLIRDEGVRGAVFRLSAPTFTEIKVHGKRVRAGGGATVAALISAAAHHGLAGL